MIDLVKFFMHGEKWLHDELKQYRQDLFPDDFRLIVIYQKDLYNNFDSPGVALSKLQETLVLMDFPNFFIKVLTTNHDIQSDLDQVRNIFCPHETILEFELIEGDFEKQLISQNTLCVLPWIHLYINPQGFVGPCGIFNEKYPIGHISTDTLDQIVNSEAMNRIRKQMLSGQRPDSCSTCWDKEDAKLPSLRLKNNQRFARYLNLPMHTKADGSVEEFKLRYLDFRASNVCNLKCRMCGGKFSSKIASEERDLYGDSAFIDLKLSKNEISNTIDYIEKNIDYLETIYFAGGEPLIMREHYAILDILIAHKKTNIEILYNTNLTQLSYKNHQVIDYWKQFTNVTVGASIDLIGAQANYVRSGTDYDKLEKNYDLIKNHVKKFNISSVVHLFNVFNLPKLQYHWIVNKNLNPVNITFHTLIYPNNMSLQVLPGIYKDQASSYIEQHIHKLNDMDNTRHLIDSWVSVLQYMNAEDKSHLLSEFFRLNDDKDRFRKEKFEEVFPEYQNLRDYIS